MGQPILRRFKSSAVNRMTLGFARILAGAGFTYWNKFTETIELSVNVRRKRPIETIP